MTAVAAPPLRDRERRGRERALLIAGLVLVAVNLRFALTSVGPLIDDLRADLGVSGTTIGLLNTAPLLMLGLVSPLAPRLAARFGAERVVLACLLAIFAGVTLRLLPPIALLFAGTLVAGCAIAIGNVIVPAIVKQRFTDRAALMSGVHSVGLSGGAALAAGLTVPIEHWVGGSWRVALALWAIPAILAAIVWLPQLKPSPAVAAAERAEAESEAAAAPPHGRPNLWRDRRAWSVTLFMGLQSLIFYTNGAWLPDILQARAGATDSTAGALLALTMGMGIPVGFLTAALASKLDDQRPLAFVAALFPAAGWLGLLLAPDTLTFLWALLLGIGAGVGFALVMALFLLRARDVAHTSALSGMAQSVGYTLAALGPLLIGALHDVTGGWALPLALLSTLAVPELIMALRAAAPGYVGE
ncbi:MFS transporter [Conexibacter sp. JD483]|uniref:CynX/NimT family MFS transporter n=1 Tax=unclassified Conexibacter TaxID=2627773 RepID=UPI00271FA5C6|nr:MULTISPECIES: MFS transporter [unclassified Conexibacter]MDO8187421.1 MFS transporter [Conexibacter sp. CPCC 205706]MDO8201016.1 MFS transporter [Conexibacter sp. CPCC 205762]MDR9370305.1 MFS transporter [Conexibacter sp. JD483]